MTFRGRYSIIELACEIELSRVWYESFLYLLVVCRLYVLGNGVDGYAGGQHPTSARWSLLCSHQLQTICMEWTRWLPQGVEQPGLLQRPLVPGDG